MCDEETKEILTAILDTLVGHSYEQGGYFTIGGGPGTYVLKSPYNTECEFQIPSVTTSSSTPIGFAISSANPSLLAPTKNSTILGAYAQGGEGNALEGIEGFVQSTTYVAYQEWIPLGRNGYIYMNTNVGASDTLLVNIYFRRSLQVYIPDMPRARPHTHTHVQSRRPIRMLHALSQQTSGFAAQYPPTGDGAYQHEPIPESQDIRTLRGLPGRVRHYGR